jgi:hypothetical protein
LLIGADASGRLLEVVVADLDTRSTTAVVKRDRSIT